jgi:hypothetical protein
MPWHAVEFPGTSVIAPCVIDSSASLSKRSRMHEFCPTARFGSSDAYIEGARVWPYYQVPSAEAYFAEEYGIKLSSQKFGVTLASRFAVEATSPRTDHTT